MVQFSAILLLYIYLGLMGILLIISLGHLFHAIRFDGFNPVSIFTSGLFIAGMVTVLWASHALLSDADWSGIFRIDLPNAQLLPFL